MFRQKVEPKTIKTPASNCGYGEITIINSPAATWANSKITFTVAPEISVSELPLGVRISQIGFIYRKVGDKDYYVNLSDNDGHSWSVYRQPDHLFEAMPRRL